MFVSITLSVTDQSLTSLTKLSGQQLQKEQKLYPSLDPWIIFKILDSSEAVPPTKGTF